MLNVKNDLFLNSVGDLISATSANNEHTILIVDDEINNLQLLKRTFRGKYRIITASNGLEGLEILKNNLNDISLIVSDHKMPIMEGTKLSNWHSMEKKFAPAFLSKILNICSLINQT